MRIFKFPFALCVALIAQILISTPVQAKWLRGETANFVIFSSGDTKQLRDYGATLERFNALISANLGITTTPSPNKLAIYFLQDSNDVDRLLTGRQGIVAGFYSTDNEGSYAVANRHQAESEFDLSGMIVLLHEYTHHFMFRNFTYAYPAWYVEGFAEYFSTTEFKPDGRWALGKVAQHRAYGLLGDTRLTMQRILTGDTSKLNDDELDLFYGRSWLLVHMLNSKLEYKGKVAAYFTAVRGGKTDLEAAHEVFGDLNMLDRALNKYRDGKLSYRVSAEPMPANTAMSVTELDPVSGQMVMLHLQRINSRNTEKTRKELRALAIAQPQRADIWYELALSERDLSKDAPKAELDLATNRSEAAIDKTLVADPHHPRANMLKAYFLMNRLEAAGTTTAALWVKARSYLVTANSSAVDDPLVLVAWYDSYALQGRAPTKIAHEALARAFELEPEITEVRVKYALDLAHQGNFDTAIGLVEFLTRDPHNPDQGKALLAQLTAMKAAAAKNAQAPPSAGH